MKGDGDNEHQGLQTPPRCPHPSWSKRTDGQTGRRLHAASFRFPSLRTPLSEDQHPSRVGRGSLFIFRSAPRGLPRSFPKGQPFPGHRLCRWTGTAYLLPAKVASEQVASLKHTGLVIPYLYVASERMPVKQVASFNEPHIAVLFI